MLFFRVYKSSARALPGFKRRSCFNAVLHVVCSRRRATACRDFDSPVLWLAVEGSHTINVRGKPKEYFCVY